jgi:putative peptidoglycan lipid II flippase
LAWRFGTSPVVDAYRVAVLLLLFGQQLFVTSILPYVVVPIFAEHRASGNEREAWEATNSLGLVFLGLGVLIALGLFLFAGSAADLLAPGLRGEGRSIAVFFLRWCGLAFVPLCWSGIACGILYACQAFRVPSLAQLASNIALLLAILIGGKALGKTSIVIGMLVGAIASAALYGWRLAKLRREFAPGLRAGRIDFRELRRLLRLAVPLMIGALVGQLSGAVVTRALSRLATGSLAAFGYGWKLGQIVLLVPTSFSTVLFPKLSDIWHSSKPEDFAASYVRGLRSLLFITIPMTCLAYQLREPIVVVLLQRGAFSATAGHVTAALFGLLILAAPGGAAVTYLDRMFYATQETTIPVVIDASGTIFVMALAPYMAVKFGADGVAFTYMLLPWLTSAVLLGVFQHKHGGFPFTAIARFTMQTAIIAGVSSWLAVKAGQLLTHPANGGFFTMVVWLIISAAATAPLYLLGTSQLGLPEADAFKGYLRRYAGVFMGTRTKGVP